MGEQKTQKWQKYILGAKEIILKYIFVMLW